MNINLSGLTFRAYSPSHFELLSVRDDVGSGDTVALRYSASSPTTDGRGGWRIDYCQPGRATVSRMFPSRDAAVQLIADRVQG